MKRATDAAVFLLLVALCFVVRTGQAHAQEVLLVVPDAANLSAQDSTKKALIESWGYTVPLISANASQANFDAAVATAGAAYVSEEINSNDVSTKLRDATIGVLLEENHLSDEMGISSARTTYTSDAIDIVVIPTTSRPHSARAHSPSPHRPRDSCM